MIRYRVKLSDPGAHVLDVVCEIESPHPDGQTVSLPRWIPGSYLIRDFARHVIEISAACNGQNLAVHKTDNSTWSVEPVAGPLSVRMRVYAYDLSVRGAYFDTTRAFFNGPCVFLKVHGFENEQSEVLVERPEDERLDDFRVATAMPAVDIDGTGFGSYRATGYDELIDHPFEISDFTHVTFDACNVPHHVAISGRHETDTAQLAKDLRRICEQHIRFFGEPAPMDQYWFLTMAVGKGFGGLEHRASSSLLCRRDELPLSGSKMTKAYRRFLGLVSHEYFHSWNVKRMKPAVFSPYELDAATPTEQLWIFEGITSYYDELALLRSGLIDTKAYLEMLAENLTRVYQTPGRTRQTLAESSYDAWIKFYQRNENSPNTVVSYYTKGAATALVLDLQVRRDTSGNKSLDDVMRAMWQGYGDGRGVPEGAFETLAEDVTGLDLQDYFDKTVRSTEEILLEELFDSVGVKMTLRAADSELGTRSTSTAAKTPPVFGAQLSNRNNRVIFQHVYDGGPAQTAGIAAGDELIAIDDLRINTETFKRRMRCCRPGDRVSVRVFRRDELMCFKVKLGKPHTDVCRLRFDSDADADTLAHRAAWLEGTLA